MTNLDRHSISVRLCVCVCARVRACVRLWVGWVGGINVSSIKLS